MAPSAGLWTSVSAAQVLLICLFYGCFCRSSTFVLKRAPQCPRIYTCLSLNPKARTFRHSESQEGAGAHGRQCRSGGFFSGGIARRGLWQGGSQLGSGRPRERAEQERDGSEWQREDWAGNEAPAETGWGGGAAESWKGSNRPRIPQGSSVDRSARRWREVAGWENASARQALAGARVPPRAGQCNNGDF